MLFKSPFPALELLAGGKKLGFSLKFPPRRTHFVMRVGLAFVCIDGAAYSGPNPRFVLLSC
jgi:hypothetical protein